MAYFSAGGGSEEEEEEASPRVDGEGPSTGAPGSRGGTTATPKQQQHAKARKLSGDGEAGLGGGFPTSQGRGSPEGEVDEEERALRGALSEARRRVTWLEAQLENCLRRKRARENNNQSHHHQEKQQQQHGAGDVDFGEAAADAPGNAADASPASGFEFVFSSAGKHGAEGLSDINDVDMMDTSAGDPAMASGAAADASPLDSPFEFVFSSPRQAAGAGKDEKVFDFVFCSPQVNGGVTPPRRADENPSAFGDGGSGGDGHGSSSDGGSSNDEPAAAAAAGGKPSRKTSGGATGGKGGKRGGGHGSANGGTSNVDSLGEALSQRLAESLSGLFIDMPSAFGDPQVPTTPTPAARMQSQEAPTQVRVCFHLCVFARARACVC